jgi:O-antigen ligase
MGYQTSSSVLSRIEIWLESIKIFKSHPIFGVGLGNIHFYVENYFIKAASGFHLIKAHNLVLELLAETGIIGLAIFGTLLFKALRIQLHNCFQLDKGFQNSLAWGILSGTLAAIVHSMVEPNIMGYMFGLVFWMIVGLSIKQGMLARPREMG